jgi:hypothetical protein
MTPTFPAAADTFDMPAAARVPAGPIASSSVRNAAADLRVLIQAAPASSATPLTPARTVIALPTNGGRALNWSTSAPSVLTRMRRPPLPPPPASIARVSTEPFSRSRSPARLSVSFAAVLLA